MGVTDEIKSSSAKCNPTNSPESVVITGAHCCHENTIPQMVVTSVEGKSEELKLENDVPPDATAPEASDAIENVGDEHFPLTLSTQDSNAEIALEEDVQLQDKPPLDGSVSAIHRPLIINTRDSNDEDALQGDVQFQHELQGDGSISAIQRPLIINGSSEVSQIENVILDIVPTDSLTKSHQSAVQRPLIVGSESVKLLDDEVLAIESIYEVIQPADSANEGETVSESPKGIQVVNQTPPMKVHEGFFSRPKLFWKQDAKPFFVFPKFSFSTKEHRESPKTTKNGNKNRKQECDLEAEKLSLEAVTAKEHVKLDEDVTKIFNSSYLKNDTELEKSYTSCETHFEKSGCKQNIALEEDFELHEQMGSLNSQSSKRANTPESLYDTCCIKFAVLLRNKAFEMAVDNSKAIPPKKPPKPSAEALAKARSEIAAKRMKESESRPHYFGDNILAGMEGIRYADEDTESSTDYKDVDNFVILNPGCYGINRKLESDNEGYNFRAPSTCSGLTSYYTADTTTLKDENSSDNTLETVSLGSYDSTVCRTFGHSPNVEQNCIQSGQNNIHTQDYKFVSHPITFAKVKKVPPPIPPKPSVLLKSMKKMTPSSSTMHTSLKSKSKDVAHCINSLSLSPRPVLRSASNTEGIKKRPLTIAGVKATEFEGFSRNEPLGFLFNKPVLNTVVKSKPLQNMESLCLEPSGLSKPSAQLEFLSSRSLLSAVPSKCPPPPRPPPPPLKTVIKKKATESSPEEQIKPIVEDIMKPPNNEFLQQHASSQQPSPSFTKLAITGSVKPMIPPPRPPPPEVVRISHASIHVDLSQSENFHQKCVEEVPKGLDSVVDAGLSHSDSQKFCNESFKRNVIDMPSVCAMEKPCLECKEKNVDLKMKFDDVSNVEIMSNNERKLQQLEYSSLEGETKCPKPPPRIHRKRSRTVEITSVTTHVQKGRRRSQSLSNIEEGRGSSFNTLALEDPVKALYTTVNKNSLKVETNFKSSENDIDKLSSSSEISYRPLPPPPLPPRSKSYSASRRSKSDERPSVLNSLFNNEHHMVKSESMPDEINCKNVLKPPTRKKKNRKDQFFSLRIHGKNQPTKFDSMKSSVEPSAMLPPLKPERRLKLQPSLKFDENANVADLSSISFSPCSSDFSSAQTESLTKMPVRPRVKSLGFESIPCEKKKISILQRSKSESKKCVSAWYDKNIEDQKTDNQDEMTDDWEKLNWLPNIDPVQSHKSSLQMKTPPRTKKPRKTSTFYVEVEQSFKEDKETSPLPLDCSEKSVQTSLETLSVGIASRDELSDNTDDLLGLAQTLQNELKTIIQRHKTGEVLKSSDESCITSETSQQISPDSFPQENSATSPSKFKIHLESAASSASEIWHLSSSEESEDDCTPHESSNLSELSLTKKKKKIFYIAQEIMSSEEAFVDALRLLNVDFRAHIERMNAQKGAAIIPDDVLNQILNHLPQLQHLNENLLMELKYRIEEWDSLNKISDVIVKMGPFLKLYSWYIQDFESTTSILEDAKRKYPHFLSAVKEYEMSPRCKRLTLNHYMLKPVQRIPQYRLLLQEYLHHLPNGSKDYEDTVEALRIVSEVANHANESMKHGDNFQKLMSIQSSIIGHKEIIKPGRMFIKEGELMKLSRKGMQPRWFVLLNDILLYLTSVQQGLYRVNHELILAGMKVAIPLQQDYQNEFSIISVTRSFTLSAKSPDERQEWIVALTKAIEENASKRSTFTAGRLQQKQEYGREEMLEQGFVLGKTAPVWIPDARVTMCQLCTSEFTVTFRRHHCRACGKVVCSICSSNRISLQYLGNRIARVCDECYTKLGQVSSGCTESGETESDNQQIAVKSHLRTDRHHKKTKRQLPSVLKEVCANDVGSTISGYVYKRINSNWKKSWFVVKQKVLYEFRASEDVAALRSIPLLGFQISTFNEPFEGIDSSLLFEISHPGQAPILFHAETPGSAERWVKELKNATILE